MSATISWLRYSYNRRFCPTKSSSSGKPPLDNSQSQDQPEMSPLKAHFLIAFVAILWMCVSSGLILLNKYILKDLNFHFPMAVTGLGMVCSSIASFITIHVLKIVPAKQTVTRRMWLTQIVPVGLCMALSMQLGNYAYLELTVAFIQMLKALCPVMTLIALCIARMLNPSKWLICSVLVMTLGVMVSSYGEVNFSWIGMGAMLGSEGAEAARLVITQVVLVGLKFHPFEGLLYMAPACVLWLATGSAIFELPAMLQEGSLQIVKEHPLMFLCAGLMGFVINILSFWVIRLASSLTLKVLATCKNTMLVVIGAVFLNETVTGIQSCGYVVTMIGFVWYQAVYVPPAVAAPTTVQKKEPQQHYTYSPVNASDDQAMDLPKKFAPFPSSVLEEFIPQGDRVGNLPSPTNCMSRTSSASSNHSGRRRGGSDAV